jgi:CTP:molybdopterin cytidylyltransferase MocA
MVTAVILAAGRGRRVGGPKALLPVPGGTFLSRVAALCREAGCDALLVVTAPPPDPVAAAAAREGLPTAENPRPDRGMFSSVQAGLAASGTPEGGVLVFPVDHPHVRVETVRRLLDAGRRAPPGSWALPLHDGRPGHPVWLDARAVQAVLAWDPAGTLREALAGSGLRSLAVPVADPGVRRNVNLVSDLD